MRPPAYSIYLVGTSIRIYKHSTSQLFPVHVGTINQPIFYPPGYYIYSNLPSTAILICTAQSKQQALSFVTLTYLTKHYPEFLV